MKAEVSRNISDDELIERCAANVLARVRISCKLAQLEIPKKVIDCVMIRCQDIGDLNPGEIAESYFQLLDLGLTKTAAAAIAASDYIERGREEALELIARNYHRTKSAYGYPDIRALDPVTLRRYKKIANYPEARLALIAVSDYEEEVYKDSRPNESQA